MFNPPGNRHNQRKEKVMKTFNGMSISKKEIAKVLRTMDPTQIFKLYHRIYGHTDRKGVLDFIKEFATSDRVRYAAYSIAYSHKHAYRRNDIEMECIKRHGFFHGDDRKNVIDMLKRECTDVVSNYAKRPMYGVSHLYFCSPLYGPQDYNKRRMIKIEGNERFCELVINYANKFFGPDYDK